MLKRSVNRSIILMFVIMLAWMMVVQQVWATGYRQGEKNMRVLTDIEGHWAEEEIIQAVEMDLINGYPDQTFRPNENITRAEFIKTLIVAFGMDVSSTPSVFIDDDNWAEGYIQAAIEKGIINPSEYPENQFEPNRKITRREIAVMAVRVLGMEEEAMAAGLKLADGLEQVDGSLVDLPGVDEHWRGHVKMASNLGIVRGYPDHTFGPDRNSTRAEAVIMILRTLDQSQSGEVEVIENEQDQIAGFPQAEFVQMLVEAMGYTETKPVPEAEGHWALEYYKKAEAAGIWDSGVEIDPNGEVTLDDAVNMMMTALGYTRDFYSWSLTFGIISRAEYEGSKSVVITEADATRYIDKLIERYEEQQYGEVILQEFVDSLELKDGVVTGYVPKVKEFYNIILEWTYFDGPTWAESEDREFRKLYSGEPFGQGGVDFEADGTKGYLTVSVTDTNGAIDIITAKIYLPDLGIEILR